MKWLLFCSLNNEYVENDNTGKKRDIDVNDDNEGNERKPPCSRQRRRPCPTCQTQLAVSGSEHGFVRNYICEREVNHCTKHQ